ncbi:hypothetical protein D770_04695 [Flammeovirgaceae bacterium 311]|nr:hypothetical protein D770_04695 [Flammeovirgaceae bacterium 311]
MLTVELKNINLLNSSILNVALLGLKEGEDAYSNWKGLMQSQIFILRATVFWLATSATIIRVISSVRKIISNTLQVLYESI